MAIFYLTFSDRKAFVIKYTFSIHFSDRKTFVIGYTFSINLKNTLMRFTWILLRFLQLRVRFIVFYYALQAIDWIFKLFLLEIIILKAFVINWVNVAWNIFEFTGLVDLKLLLSIVHYQPLIVRLHLIE